MTVIAHAVEVNEPADAGVLLLEADPGPAHIEGELHEVEGVLPFDRDVDRTDRVRPVPPVVETVWL